ncbi:MAG: hypothetical protein QOD75_679 [Blastocatellia bacterium]|jgi:hypothetical protein|nr:hypothetical protein [Blastocatellia bacterium]
MSGEQRQKEGSPPATAAASKKALSAKVKPWQTVLADAERVMAALKMPRRSADYSFCRANLSRHCFYLVEDYVNWRPEDARGRRMRRKAIIEKTADVARYTAEAIALIKSLSGSDSVRFAIANGIPLELLKQKREEDARAQAKVKAERAAVRTARREERARIMAEMIRQATAQLPKAHSELMQARKALVRIDKAIKLEDKRIREKDERIREKTSAKLSEELVNARTHDQRVAAKEQLWRFKSERHSRLPTTAKRDELWKRKHSADRRLEKAERDFKKVRSLLDK